MTQLKILLFSIFLAVSVYTPKAYTAQNVITYQFSGGRFGDNLLAYLHAKWFAHEHNLILLYKPFPYSDCLLMHQKEIHQRNNILRKKLKLKPFFKAHIKRWPFLSKLPFFSFYYVCPYFPEELSEIESGHFHFFEVNWKDEVFRKKVFEMMTPLQELTITKPPFGIPSIAIHVREGGGYDRGFYREELPLKFPPLSFYIEALNEILRLFPNQKLYCHIFTDAKTPKDIVEKIQNEISCKDNITFGYRQNLNQYDKNVLEDFFSLFEFDILIRPQSNFSLIPSLLKDYAIVFAPRKISSDTERIFISEIDLQIDSKLYQRLLK